MIRQCYDFSFNILGGAVYLPKYSLVWSQPKTNNQPARWLVVYDPRQPAQNYKFLVWAFYANGQKRSFWADSRFDRIGMGFARFVDELPRNMFHAPVWRIRYGDNIGQPQDRKPQKMNMPGRRMNENTTTDRSVVDGHIIGGHRYREEGYNALRLNIQVM